MTCGRRMVPASPNSGETPALHPARETRARPFHGFWVVAAATMDDCYKKGLASMGPRKRIISATSALKMPPCTAGACPGLPWVPPQACSAGVPPVPGFGLQWGRPGLPARKRIISATSAPKMPPRPSASRLPDSGRQAHVPLAPAPACRGSRRRPCSIPASGSGSASVKA